MKTIYMETALYFIIDGMILTPSSLYLEYAEGIFTQISCRAAQLLLYT